MNRLSMSDCVRIVASLVEGNSSRMTGAAKGTILKLLADLGKVCAAYHNENVRNVPAKRVQCDKIWSFCYGKEKNISEEKKAGGAGSLWTWTALEIDGVAYFKTGKIDNAKIIFQVKSGGVKRGDIATLRGDMEREGAAMSVLITLEDPSRPMLQEAKAAGQYSHQDMGRSYERISIVTVKEIVEDHAKLEIPMSLEVLKAAQKAAGPEEQMELL